MISDYILNKMNDDELRVYIKRKEDLDEKYDNVICANDALNKKYQELYNAQDFAYKVERELMNSHRKLSNFELLMKTKYDPETKDIVR